MGPPKRMSIISFLVACVFAMYLYCSRNVVFLPTNVDVRAQEAEAPRVSELGSLFRSTNRPLPPWARHSCLHLTYATGTRMPR